MKVFCIINLAELWIDWLPPFKTASISKKNGPTIFYTQKIDAETELMRLQEKHPDGDFYLFEAIGQIVRSMHDKKILYLVEPETI